MQQAALNAEEVLRGHLLLLIEEGEAIPGPSDLDAIAVDPDVREAARILVRADLPGKPKRINIILDENLIAAIDAVASNRSGFIAEAARAALLKR